MKPILCISPVNAWNIFMESLDNKLETELLRIAKAVLPALQPATLMEKTDLFNGSAGVMLFYLRLYEHYREPYYLEVCTTAADTLLYHPDILQPPYFTFYTGAAGLLYVCTQLYEASGHHRYLERALQLVNHFRSELLQQVVQDDLLSGHAGNLLVLTHLHAYTKEETLLPLIRTLADTLIRQARIAPNGLRWGHVKMSYDSLTGFSHGASGIAFALMQVAAYFGDEGLYYLAEQSLDYEMQYYDAAARNWLDLRLTSTSLAREAIFHWEITRFRKDAADTNTWAHGAAGVGIARLFAWKQSPRADWLQQVRDAVQRSLEDVQALNRGDFTLCSGYGGIVFFLLQAATALEQPELRQTAQRLAWEAVCYYHAEGTYNCYVPTMMQDPGLFSGLSGVGYMLLSVLMPPREDAIVHPVIPAGESADAPLYPPGVVKKMLFSKYYPHTLRLLKANGWQLPDMPDIAALELVLQKAVAASAEAADCFALEYRMTALWKHHKGLLYYAQRKMTWQKSIDPEHVPDTKWIPVEEAQLCVTQWPWYQDILHEPGIYYYLLQNQEYGMAVFPVGKLTAVIFDNLQAGRTLRDVLSAFLEGPASEQATAAVVAQTISMMEQGLIRPEVL
ncbi:lanthionine synthetase LanC family protein [Chitinophaga qingshengii]|uniref:Lanthionine synthetase C-like protein n=1 Tax=Chitinophaga qingshengii TaxID=1569794 RepID=A0ABR7TRA3_9BACT|nr:lanthionine synthetase LanC family protein [Chitinophaga qingshengii]MBC9932021.1 hypothetical protein [Chitinophaga qingshengii]